MNSKLETVKSKPIPSLNKADKNAMNLAASWYIAMLSKDLGKKPKAIELFGQSLVAWRDENGHPVIMERFCSHMGASLAIGKVVDGCIRCPYHHWRYDGSGQCVSIPEVDHIPPTARQATYVTAERYGYIWVWYGTQTPLFSIPEFPAAEAQKHNYMPLRYAYETNTTVRRIVENAFDYYHVPTLHEQKNSGSVQVTLLDDPNLGPHRQLPISREGWFGALEEFSIHQPFGFNAQSLTLWVDAWPGGHLVTALGDGKEKVTALLWTTPIAERKTVAHLLAMVKKTGNFLLDIPTHIIFSWQSQISTRQDLSIWNSEEPEAGGAYVKLDRVTLKFREFYQRWVDKVNLQ